MTAIRRLTFVTHMHERRFVRLYRKFEPAPVRGYVLDVGREFFLMAVVNDGVRYEGFQCFRVRDTTSVGADPYAEFAEAALRKRGLRRPRKPRVSMQSLVELLETGSRAFPLVTIHREEVDRDGCQVGRVMGVGRGRVRLLEIAPNATWDKKPRAYRLSEITRVDFGGDYEQALFLVGGKPAMD